MAKKDSTAATTNPLIDEDNPLDTLYNVKAVIWFLALAGPSLAEEGSNDHANHGLAMVLECTASAVEHASKAFQAEYVEHAKAVKHHG